MILTGFTLAMLGLLYLVGWAMRRLKRGQVLRLLALVTQRQMPLEGTLSALSRTRTAAHEERLIQKLMMNMTRGADLPLALSLSGVVTPQQAVALQLAEKRGVAHQLLERLADHVTQTERRLVASEITLAYPLIIGAALAAKMSFLTVFIMPKFDQLYRKMDFIPRYDLAFDLGSTLPYAMLLWGLLAVSLQSQRCGDVFWCYIPWVRQHFRISEQAAFARNLSLALSSGAPLEEVIDAIAAADAGGPFRRAIARVNAALKRGEGTLAAFQTIRWRPEFLWAIDSITHGVPPGPCLELAATVLEDKAKARLDGIHRVCMPLATLVTAIGVGLLGTAIFEALYGIARGLMR